MRRVFLISIQLIALLVVAGAGFAASTTSVTLSDLPRGYAVSVNHSVGVKDLQAIVGYVTTPSSVSAHGFQSAFDARFLRKARKKGATPDSVDNVVIRFSSVAGAHWYFQHWLPALGKTTAHWQHYTARVGNESDGRHDVGIQPTRVWIIFRQGQYFVSLRVQASSANESLATARRLAPVVDGRIVRNG